MAPNLAVFPDSVPLCGQRPPPPRPLTCCSCCPLCSLVDGHSARQPPPSAATQKPLAPSLSPWPVPLSSELRDPPRSPCQPARRPVSSPPSPPELLTVGDGLLPVFLVGCSGHCHPLPYTRWVSRPVRPVVASVPSHRPASGPVIPPTAPRGNFPKHPVDYASPLLEYTWRL